MPHTPLSLIQGRVAQIEKRIILKQIFSAVPMGLCFLFALFLPLKRQAIFISPYRTGSQVLLVHLWTLW